MAEYHENCFRALQLGAIIPSLVKSPLTGSRLSHVTLVVLTYGIDGNKREGERKLEPVRGLFTSKGIIAPS